MKVNPRKMKLVFKEPYETGLILVYQNDTHTTALYRDAETYKTQRSFVAKHPSDEPDQEYGIQLALARLKKPMLCKRLEKLKNLIIKGSEKYNQIANEIEEMDVKFKLTKEIRNGIYVPRKRIALDID